MSEFNPVDYFKRRANEQAAAELENQPGTKYQAMQESLLRAGDALISTGTRNAAAVAEAAERNKNSLATSMGLNPDEGAMGKAVNLGASLASGTSRLVGDVAGFALGDIPAMALDASISEEEVAAIGRHKQGQATASDVELINRVNPYSVGGSALERYDAAIAARQRSADIDGSFDQTSLVHSGARDRLKADLGDDFQGAWDQVKHGFRTNGGSELVSGVAKLVFNAAEAAVTNPQAAAEYITENVPQLAIGMVGRAGASALLLSNVAYASENYQKGIAKYQSENQGANGCVQRCSLPSPESSTARPSATNGT